MQAGNRTSGSDRAVQLALGAEQHRQAGRLPQAEAGLRHALRVRPDCLEALINLAAVLIDRRRFSEAEKCSRQALLIRPGTAEAHLNLGMALLGQHSPEEAARACREALRLKPDLWAAHLTLAHSLVLQKRAAEAEIAAREILRLDPESPEGYLYLGEALRLRAFLEPAVAAYFQALAARPQYGNAYLGLGKALYTMGRLEDSLECFRLAARFDPENPTVHSKLLFLSHYSGSVSPEQLQEEHAQWGLRHAGPLMSRPVRFGHDRDPGRPLRVGYVSADFREHPVGYFFSPVLACHDRDRVQAICYSNHAAEDSLTARLRQHAAGWRSTAQLPDEEFAGLVREDGIDILVDLSGHTAHNRLLAFARRLAPVQASWLGYFNTTGVKTMDYLLVDSVVCPPGEPPFVEQPLRLPGCYLCYQPHGSTPEVAPAPVLQSGRITFGSLNNPLKINAAVVRLWSMILAALPESRLVLQSFDNQPGQDGLLRSFAACGIAAGRIELLGRRPQSEVLRAYSSIDIALDPFPYSGGATTCEALWMGVPVVTFRGDTFVSRVGATLLTHGGCGEWVAGSAREYMELALQLAADVERLAGLRAGLRSRLAASSLCDVPAFTQALENAYRTAWRRFCVSPELL